MNGARRVFFIVVLLAIAFNLLQRAGCNSSQSSNVSSAPPPAATVAAGRPLANVARRPIPLDDTQPGTQVSLTRNFYFVFDGSGSMNDALDKSCRQERQFAHKIDGAKWAVREFLKAVPDDVNIGLYVFDARGQREVVPIGAVKRETFTTAIDQVVAGGGTPLADAIHFATDRLVKQYQKQLGYGEYRLIVVTDGLAEHIPDAATYAAEYGIAIYAIGLCIGADHPLRQYAVSYRAADNFTDLAKGLEATLAELPAFDAAEFGK
jgi:Mg-chelatase subunit ChlD